MDATPTGDGLPHLRARNEARRRRPSVLRDRSNQYNVRKSEMTRLLLAASAGDRQAAADVLPLVYEELRKLAAARMAVERPGNTLDATALIRSAMIKISKHNVRRQTEWMRLERDAGDQVSDEGELRVADTRATPEARSTVYPRTRRGSW